MRLEGRGCSDERLTPIYYRQGLLAFGEMNVNMPIEDVCYVFLPRAFDVLARARSYARAARAAASSLIREGWKWAG